MIRWGGVPVHMPIAAGARFSHIPLTLLYSSLTKLFLLFCLSIWRPDTAAKPQPAGGGAHAPLAPLHPNATAFSHPLVARALALLDEDRLDREWVVRNVLGGMAAGFGLRGNRSPAISLLRFFSPSPSLSSPSARHVHRVRGNVSPRAGPSRRSFCHGVRAGS